MERNTNLPEPDRTVQSTEAEEAAIWARICARYAEADAEVAEELDDGQRMARSELAALLTD